MPVGARLRPGRFSGSLGWMTQPAMKIRRWISESGYGQLGSIFTSSLAYAALSAVSTCSAVAARAKRNPR